MGQNTTAFNSDELITSYIDNQISDPGLRKQVEDMISGDAGLNNKYRSELLTKNLLKERIKQSELPFETYNKINSSINLLIQNSNAEAYQNTLSFRQTLVNTITAPIRFGRMPVPRYAFAVVLLIIAASAFYYLNSKSSNIKNPHVLAGTEKSIMVQAVNSFHKILDGDFTLQYKSSNAAEVEKFVRDNAFFNVFVPKIDNYILTGCILNEYNGRKLAHLVYVSGDDIIYIYQTTMDAIVKNDLDLPQQVRDEIVSAKYYMCDGVDDNNCTMTLWFRENVVCASMSTMPKQQMYTAFTGFVK
ncbi:MAG TPA: hypothetical protein VJ455_09515 [Ignavibacteria bacterium]|nr:hypothetical protein [Ignavibacteria bacterium]